MSEQLSPNSIPNNYALQEQPSGLWVAESRANHSYKNHPHPVNDEGQLGPVEHEKTRGIVYNETELGGKPFIIAERPQPDASKDSEMDDTDSAKPEDYVPDWTSPTLGQDKGESSHGDNKNRDNGSGEYEFPNQIPVRYDARQDGKVQLGVEIDDFGTVVEFGKHEKTRDPNNRRAMITDTEGNEFYVRDQFLYKITDDGDDRDWKITGYAYIGNAPLSDLTLGETWERPFPDGKLGPKTTFPIDSVEVPTELADENTDLEAFDDTGPDPFERAETLIRELKSQLKHDRAEAVNQINGRSRLHDLTRLGRERGEGRNANAERRRWRNRVVGFLGVMALAGVVGFGAAKYIHEGQPGSKPVPAHTAKAKASPGHKQGHTREKLALADGQDPWTVSEDQLKADGNAHPTNAQIETYDQQMAQINSDIYHYFGDSSEDIPVGTQLTLPNV